MQVFMSAVLYLWESNASASVHCFPLTFVTQNEKKSHYLHTFINKRSMVFKKEANNLINAKYDMKYSYTLHCSDSYNVCDNEAVLATSPIVF